MGFLELVTVLFVAAKLFGFISWSWWLVLTSLYFAVLVDIVILTLVYKFGWSGFRKLQNSSRIKL